MRSISRLVSSIQRVSHLAVSRRSHPFPRIQTTKGLFPRFYSESNTPTDRESQIVSQYPANPSDGPAKPLKDLVNTSGGPAKPPRPEYRLTVTCKPCGWRSEHHISKQGYHFGSVLITCPECRNRHVISDHLNIFGDRNIDIEGLMREQGEIVKRGTLNEDGNVEFWGQGYKTDQRAGADGLWEGMYGHTPQSREIGSDPDSKK